MNLSIFKILIRIICSLVFLFSLACSSDNSSADTEDCDETDSTSECFSGQAATVDNDGDTSYSDEDCNDEDSSVYPGATEIAGDGIDQDCTDLDKYLTSVTVATYTSDSSFTDGNFVRIEKFTFNEDGDPTSHYEYDDEEATNLTYYSEYSYDSTTGLKLGTIYNADTTCFRVNYVVHDEYDYLQSWYQNYDCSEDEYYETKIENENTYDEDNRPTTVVQTTSESSQDDGATYDIVETVTYAHSYVEDSTTGVLTSKTITNQDTGTTYRYFEFDENEQVTNKQIYTDDGELYYTITYTRDDYGSVTQETSLNALFEKRSSYKIHSDHTYSE